MTRYQTRFTPCPFCGEKKKLEVYDEGNGFGVYCPTCYTLGPQKSTTRAAVRAWNTRHVATVSQK